MLGYQLQAEHCFKSTATPHPHSSSTQAPLHTSTTRNVLETLPQFHSVTEPTQSLPLPFSSDHQRVGWQSLATYTLTQEHEPLPSCPHGQETTSFHLCPVLGAVLQHVPSSQSSCVEWLISYGVPEALPCLDFNTELLTCKCLDVPPAHM